MTGFLTLSGAPVPPNAFGTMQWGDAADGVASHALFEQCRTSGIRHFDTAVAYTNGQSERLLGTFVKSDREALFVATKVSYTGGASATNITAQFDRSRQQLDMDVVDLLYLHRFDPDTPLERTFETMARLQSEGHIRHIGVSNYAAWQVIKAQSICAALGTRIDAVQPMYSLVKRQAEVEILPMAMDQDIAVLPYSPLGGGLLTGKYHSGGTGRLTEDNRYAARYGVSMMHDAADALTKLAADHGTHPATLAVAWVATHPAGPHPIISARNTDQLAPSLAGLNYRLTSELYQSLSDLYPAPPPATDRLEEART